MILYLFDTDTVSFLMKRKFPQLHHRFLKAAPESVAISAVTYAEILFGLEPFPVFHPLRFRAAAFLASAQILDWPSQAAIPYADIRHRTRQQPIGDRDSMIAAHAIAIGATLVTNNIRHFSRVGEPLRLANWLD